MLSIKNASLSVPANNGTRALSRERVRTTKELSQNNIVIFHHEVNEYHAPSGQKYLVESEKAQKVHKNKNLPVIFRCLKLQGFV